MDWIIQLPRGIWSLKRALQEEQGVVGFVSAEFSPDTSAHGAEEEVVGTIQITLVWIYQNTRKRHFLSLPRFLCTMT